MRKTAKIHYWVGVLAALFLFIQSASGIYMYFQQKSMQANIQGNMQSFQQQRGNFQNQQGGNANSSDNSSSAGQNGTSSFNGQNRSYNRGQMNFNRQGMGGTNSFSMALRKLQNNIVSLIIMLIISGAGLVLSIMIGSKRKKSNEVI